MNFSEGTSPTDILTQQEIFDCLKVLGTLAKRPELCDTGPESYATVRDQAAFLLRRCRQQQKKDNDQRDRELLDATNIRGRSETETQVEAGFVSPSLSKPRSCYICKLPYEHLHSFYDCLCPKCGDFNYAKRLQSEDLTGRVALVTGGRIKIGFQTALKLLRAGASVVLTTRFRCDAARRFAQQDDFPLWSDRLQIHALDMRFLSGVEQFGTFLAARLDRLDMVVNNAAQTVRRPPAFYRHLLEGEQQVEFLPTGARNLLSHASAPSLPGNVTQVALAAMLTQIPLLPGDENFDAQHFPPGRRDENGQQVDLRPRNSWALDLGEVAPTELVEVHAVNCLAPFILLRCLEPLLFAADGSVRYVVNVSAAEGQFSTGKSSRHPHTCMAKAALNMITRTSAESYARHNVFMNSVDTGWISNEAPHPRTVDMAAEGFREPLDGIDAAARILDPIFVGIKTGNNEYGKFLKDFSPVVW